jgi:hypothetical protein
MLIINLLVLQLNHTIILLVKIIICGYTSQASSDLHRRFFREGGFTNIL